LREEVWAHKTSLIPSHFIEVSVPSQESEWSCICVFWVSILLRSSILVLHFEAVPTVVFWSCSDSVVFWNCSDSVVFLSCSDSVVFLSCSDSVVFWSCSDSVVFFCFFIVLYYLTQCRCAKLGINFLVFTISDWRNKYLQLRWGHALC
jgi:hypothetical protein